MCWLHRLLYHCEQLFAQLRQVELVLQGRTEAGQHSFRVIFAAIEATINDGLDALAQGLEESRDDQRRDDNWHRRVPGDPLEDKLEAEDQRQVG